MSKTTSTAKNVGKSSLFLPRFSNQAGKRTCRPKRSQAQSEARQQFYNSTRQGQFMARRAGAATRPRSGSAATAPAATSAPRAARRRQSRSAPKSRRSKLSNSRAKARQRFYNTRRSRTLADRCSILRKNILKNARARCSVMWYPSQHQADASADTICWTSAQSLVTSLEAIAQNERSFLKQEPKEAPLSLEVQEPAEENHTRIPRMSPRKRPSLEIPTDLQSPRTMNLKRQKTFAGTFTNVQQPAVKVQSGDRVKVVRGAKKKFLGQCGKVDKFLSKKAKWGIQLDSGSKICLGATCFKVLAKTSTLASGDAVDNQIRASLVAAALPQEPRNTLPGMASFKALTTKPANSQALTEYRASFPSKLRPKNYKQMILAACVVGRADVIMALVMNGKCDVNLIKKVDGAHTNLMHTCIENGQTECALLLLEMGIVTGWKDDNGRTALMFSAERGLLDLVVALSQAGADLDEKNAEGETALMLAAMNGHNSAVEYLLEQDADVELTDNMMKNALAHAMSSRDAAHKKIVDTLITRMYKNNLVEGTETVELLNMKIQVPRVSIAADFMR